VTEPPPPLYCGEFDGAWRPPESLDELLPELLEDPDELDPDEPDPDEPEPDELDPDELDPDDVEPLLLLPVTDAWLVPGRITATAPAASTLAAPAAIVAAFSRRRPSSRSATACATRRACAARSARSACAAGPPRAACFSQLFTTSSVTCSSAGVIG
jgi:hypothetical protein